MSQPQAILMREWADIAGNRQRLYRLTTPCGERDWLLLLLHARAERACYARVCGESGDSGVWLGVTLRGTSRSALAALGYQEVVP